MPSSMSLSNLPKLSSLAINRFPDEVTLRFRVRASLSSGKTVVHLSNLSENSSVHPYDFFCGVWMGASNPHMDFQRFKGRPDGTGEASVSLKLRAGDVDTFKIGLYVLDPKTHAVRHIASGFQTLDWLCQGIEGVADCDSAKQSLIIKDNYTPNQALLHFCSEGCDLSVLRALLPSLQPSALHENDDVNKIVLALSGGLHDCIEQMSSVSNSNGGTSFLNCTCFTQCMGCATNYPLLDMTYSSERHRTCLPMLAYMGLATLHYLGMSPDYLLKLGDADFVNTFVVPVCTSFTVCPKTAVYSGDETIGLSGNLDNATEDFAMVMSKHFYAMIGSEYKDGVGAQALSDMSHDGLVKHIQTLSGRKDPGDARAFSTIIDDCETLSGLIKANEGGIHKFHLASVALHAEQSKGKTKALRVEQSNGKAKAAGQSELDEAHDGVLAKMMWDATRGVDSLASVPFQDFSACARLFGRYGRLRENSSTGKGPCAQMGLCVVSAKGPSFSFTNCELNGHACVVAQTISADGEASYAVAEGTSNLTMRDLPAGCKPEVSLMLTSGPKKFATLEALGIIAGNMADYIKTSGKTRVGEFIPLSFKGEDPYKTCPFYMAGFFVGLQMDRYTPAIVPMEMRAVKSNVPVLKESGVTMAAGAGEERVQAVFGAPVVGLSGSAVRAMPINLKELFGQEMASKFLTKYLERDSETHPPAADESDIRKIMSRWAALQPLDARQYGKYDPEHTWICSCSEAFGDADVLRAMIEYKSRLARKFNALQAEDPKSDGVQMVVKGHMLSVLCQFYVPLPRQDQWELSCARNIQLAVEALKLPNFPAVSDASNKQIGSAVPCRFGGLRLMGSMHGDAE